MLHSCPGQQHWEAFDVGSHLCPSLWECRCQMQDHSHFLEGLPRSCCFPAQQLLAVFQPQAATKDITSLAPDPVA